MSRPRRWIRLTVAGVIAYLCFLAATFPARVAWDIARSQGLPGGMLDVQAPKGTVWNGEARVVLQGLHLDSVRWQLLPTRLVAGRLAYWLDVDLAGGTGRGELRLGVDSLEIRDALVDLHATAADTLLPRLPVNLDGRLLLDLHEVVLERDGRLSNAEGVVGWLQAATGFGGQPLALGDLRAQITTADDGRLIARLRDQGGALALDGSAEWHADRRYRVSAHVAARPEAGAGLEQALSSIGPRQPDGRYRLEMQGRL